MIAYNTLFIILALNSILSTFSKIFNGIRLVLVMSAFMLFVYLLGFRYGVGPDYFTYRDIFESIQSSGQGLSLFFTTDGVTHIEGGYAALVRVIGSVYDSNIFFVFVTGLVAIALKLFAFYRMSPYLSASLIIYFCEEWFWKDLSGARTSIAATLLLLAIFQVAEGKKINSAMLILAASLFHNFAILGFLLMLAGGWLTMPSVMFWVLVTSAVAAVIGGFGISAVETAVQLLGLGVDFRLTRYLDSEYIQGISTFGGTFSLHFAISITMIFLYEKLTAISKYNVYAIPLYVYGTSLMFLFIDFGIISGRFREFFCLPSIALIAPSLVFCARKVYRPVLMMLLVVYAGIWYVLMANYRGAHFSIFDLP
jgi:hypothetical protein